MTDQTEQRPTGASPKTISEEVVETPEVDSSGEADNPWRQAEADLRATIDDSRASAHAVHEEWRRSLDALFAEWRKFLSDLQAGHSVRLEDLIANRPETGLLSRDVVREYRLSCVEDVIKPLLSIVAPGKPSIDISKRFQELVDALGRLPETYPENVRVLERTELYSRDGDDSAWVRVRKSAHRTRLRSSRALLSTRNLGARLLGRPARTQPPSSRVVPARNLASYYLRQKLPELLLEEHDAAHHRLAEIMEGVERVVASWMTGVLMVAREASADLEAFGPSIPWESIARDPAVPEKERQEQPAASSAAAANGEPAEDDGRRPSEEAPEEDEKSLFEQLVQHATRFQSGLEELLNRTDPGETVKEDRLSQIFGSLDRDIGKAGTLLLRSSDRVPLEPPPVLQMLAEKRARWQEWHSQVNQRVQYYLNLMRLRDRLLGLEQDFVRRVVAATVEPVLTTFVQMSERLEEARQQVGSRAAEARKKDDPLLMVRAMEASREQLVGYVQQVFRHLPGLVSSDQALSDPARKEWDDLGRFVQTLPEQVRLHSLQSDAPTRQNPKLIVIGMRELVADVLEPPLPDRLRRPAEQLRSAVRRVWTETEQVQHIVQYNLDAAIDELTDAEAEEQRPEADPGDKDTGATPNPLDSAEKLVADGMGRASMTLSHLAASLRPEWSKFVEAVNSEFRQDWTDVHRRLNSADTAEEQWAGFRAHVGRQFDQVLDRARVRLQKAYELGARIFTAGRRRAESLIKIGQSAVGVLDTGESARYETIDALAAVKDLQQNLPLIYRRLFSFEPLDETSLLEGRARDLVWVKQHFTRWKEAHQLGVLLIQAPIGSGRTSFLNAVSDTILADYKVCRISLKERIYHPDEFALVVARNLGYEDAEITIDDLESRLAHAKRSEPPHVCFIDNLEHLVLRAPNGGKTIERIILFLSRTDRSIYWIGTVGTHTWQYLSKTAGTAVGFVDSYQLTPLDKSAIESLIINRHRRSGLTLLFAEPQDASALLRQRLKRAKTAEQRQAIAREDYFDRLWRASGQNVMLALFYWIRSAQFNEDDSSLTVQSLKPLKFDYLNDLPLDHAFTLKALFLHKTISLSDHSRVFNMRDAQSTAILESLLNSHIIEEVPLSERVHEDYHVTRDAIYRLRPLIIHPVTSYLLSRNIVY